MLAIEHFVISHLNTGVSRHSSHAGYQAGFDPSLDFVVRHILADRVDQIVPFELIRVRLRLWPFPEDIVAGHVLTLVNPALSRRVPRGRDHRAPLGSVGVASKLIVATWDGAPVDEHLRAVCERVLDRIGIEVLVDAIVSIVPSSGSHRVDRPVFLHPAAFVDVVDQEVADSTATGPKESVESAQLVEQFALHVFGLFGRCGRTGRTGHSVGSEHEQIADLAVANPIEQLSADDAVSAHEANADFQVPFDRELAQLEHLAARRTVDRHGLFHKDVEPLLDGVLEHHPAKRRGSGQDRHVARTQGIHRLLVAIEAHELPFLGHIDLLGMILFESRVAARESIFKDIGHGDELDFAVVDLECVFSRPGATPTASDQRHANLVVFGRMDRAREGRGQACGGSQACGGLHKVSSASRRRSRVVFKVHSKTPNWEGFNPLRDSRVGMEKVVGR